MISLIKLGLTAFSAAGLVTKVIVVCGALVSVAATGGIIYHHIWSNGEASGYARAIKEIAEQDESALAAARAARNRVLGCRAIDGMRWDSTTGKCQGR
jgi:hypothetical protein